MPIYELHTMPIKEYKDRFTIEALQPLKHLPTKAKTLAEAEGFLLETDALAILAGYAIAQSNARDRLSAPGLLLGSSDYLKKWGMRLPKDEYGLEQEDKQPVVAKLEENHGSMLAVTGMRRSVSGKEVFVPDELRIFGKEGTEGTNFGLVYPVREPCRYNLRQYITASHNDGLLISYSSRWPAGEVNLPVYHGNSKETVKILNDPSAVLRCISTIARLCITEEVVHDTHTRLGIQRHIEPGEVEAA